MKKIKDLTLKEMRKICKKYNDGNCVNCPLYFGSSDFECFCYFDAKNIEDEMVEVEEDEKEN